MRCYSCGQTNNANARYCNGCGASLAVTAWAQPAQSEQVFTGQAYLPVETSYTPAPAPAPYAPPQPVANGYVMAADAAGYPQGYAVPVPGFGYAPFGYPAPAPVAGPSLVNTVTVNQVAPTISPPPPAPAPTVMADRHASGLTVVLSALFLLGGGIALGALWFAAAQGSNDGGAWAVVMAITLVVLLLYILIVDRLARR